MNRRLLSNRRRDAATLFALTLLSIALVTLLVPSPAYSQSTPVAAFNFDEGGGSTLNDRSGSGNNGTLVNGPAWSTGKNGGALSFDGSDDYVDVGDVAKADSLSSFTISSWVKFQSNGGGTNQTHLIDKSRCDAQGNGGPWELGVSLSSSRKAELVVYPLNGTPYYWFVFSGPSKTNVDDGNWHYITGRYDGSYLSIWVDGVQESAAYKPGIVTTNTGSKIDFGGRCNGGRSFPFRGALDDVRIYNRALSASEIQADMNTPVGGASGSPPAEPPPGDSTAPSVSISAPANNAQVSGTVSVSANASDNIGVAAVRFFVDGAAVGSEDTAAPYAISWNSTLTNNGSHSITAVARDAAGNQTTSAAITVNVANDSGAPTPPSSLRSTNVTASSVTLAWNASSDDVGVTAYRVYRNESLIGTTGNTSYTSSGLSASTAYSFYVRAIDAAGNASPSSNVLSVTTSAGTPPADTTAPSVPNGLRSSNVTTSSATIAWNASTDNVAVTGYRVYRNGSSIGTTGGTSLADSNLSASTTYTYTVSAYDAAGNASNQSTQINVTTDANQGGSGSYSTNFDATENPISEGGRWKRANNAWTDVRTSGGIAYGTNGVTNGYDDSYSILSGFGPNQTVEAVVYRSSSLNRNVTHEVELALRFSDDANNARGYECLFAFYGQIQIVRWNGGIGNFTVLSATGPQHIYREFQSGDVIKASMIGNTISVYVNGTLVAQAVDSMFQSGQPGMSFFTRPGGNSAHFGLTSLTATSN